MRDALSIFEQIRVRAGSEHDRLALTHGLASADAPIAGLNIIHQQATLSSELLGFYIRWAQDPLNSPVDLERRRLENSLRVIAVGKAALILSLSAVESSAKSAGAQHPSCRLAAKKGRTYLTSIIDQSASAGLLSREMESGWEAVIELRNTLVHNNAVPERTFEAHLPGGPIISLTSGQMMRGSPKLLAEVLLWTTGAFAEWADAFLKRARAP